MVPLDTLLSKVSASLFFLTLTALLPSGLVNLSSC